MGNGKGPFGFRAVVVALILAAPASVFAHARLMNPPPRSPADDNKSGPCGNVPRTTAFTQYEAGATITVTWQETIDHNGCFDIVFSEKEIDPTSGGEWRHLKRIQDDAGTPNTTFTTTVQLPAGITCEKCTLALRQIMHDGAGGKCPGGTCVCNATDPDEMDGGSPTYYSCADIRVGDFPDAAPSIPVDGGTSSSSSGGADPGDPNDPGSSTSSGGARNLRAGAGDDGCSVGWGGATGIPAILGLGVGALAMLRRRRR